MRNFIKILSFSLLFFVASCGVPNETQNVMSESLQDELNESFIDNKVVLPYKISVELKDVETNDDNETGHYKASFLYSFQNFWDKSEYDVRGIAYFDSDGYIVKENGKKNIRLNVISKNSKLVSSEELIKLRPKDTLGW